jgi:hypothetical protein
MGWGTWRSAHCAMMLERKLHAHQEVKKQVQWRSNAFSGS